MIPPLDHFFSELLCVRQYSDILNMAWLCRNSPVNNTSGNISNSFEVTDNYLDNNSLVFTSNSTEVAWRQLSGAMAYVFVMRQIVIPLICLAGILGNLVTLLVFIKRLWEAPEMLERGSLVGMIGKVDCSL